VTVTDFAEINMLEVYNFTGRQIPPQILTRSQKFSQMVISKSVARCNHPISGG
jgi:hypothetical protein